MTPLSRLTLLSASLMVAHANADTIEWTGGGDGVSWGDPDNWQNIDNGNAPGVPTASDLFSPLGATIEVNAPGATYSTPIISASGTVNVNSGGVLTGTGANFRVARYIFWNVNDGGTFNIPFDADIRKNVTIASGGVFTGGDAISDSAIVSIGGEWSPSDSDVGTANLIATGNGQVVMQSTGTLFLDLFGNNDNEFIDVTHTAGDLILNTGTITLMAQGGYTPQPGDFFDLWNDTAGGNVVPGDGSNITLAGYTLDISTFSVDGIVTVVPEPGVYAGVMAVVAGLAVYYRRRLT